MRRFLRPLTKCGVRRASYLAGLFNFKVIPGELFPYPTRKFDEEESENTQTLIEQIRSNDKELNTAGALIATEYGGLGLSHTAHALICEELGTTGETAMLQLLQHCALSSCLISNFGSRETKGKYLTAMSDGSVVMGWALRETCGPDMSMHTTQAEARDGAYYITGRKGCDFAGNATHFLVQARTLTQIATPAGPSEAHRSSFFVVAKDSPGVECLADGYTIVFDNAKAEDVVGSVGSGYKDGMMTLLSAQYAYASALLGTLKRAVQELRNNVADRWATDTIASCACTIYAMEAALYALTANYDKPTEDSFIETALVAAFVQRAANEWLSSLATAIPTTTALERCFASARLLLAAMESGDFLNAAAVCCGVEDYGLMFQRSSTLQMVQLRTARSMGLMEHIPLKEIDCTAIDKAIVSFGNAVEATFVRNTSNVPQQQLILNRLGEAGGLLYAASATAARAAMCLHKRLPTAKTEKELAAAFIAAATARATVLSDECRNIGYTADESYKRIALELCEDALQA